MAEANLVGGVVGGLLIGAASVMLLLLNGRIAGVSGILAGIASGSPGDRSWRVAFVTGLILGGVTWALIRGGVPLHLQQRMPGLLIAGLLVGMGTRIGSGCTSGHGVCGLARLSPRSFAATAIFMIAAIVTVYISRHIF
ncbi:MAG TPA: YeeE/YedE family protein [Verrucomicrobiae bacterium]|jgi:uncharacterized membrane protein YedE/YeeE|nr:YeeE/YedE family protein [Verrucomicrobiae bacterium]